MEAVLAAQRVRRWRSRGYAPALCAKEADFEGAAEWRNWSHREGERLEPASRPRSDGMANFRAGEGRRESGESAARGHSQMCRKGHQQLYSCDKCLELC